MKAIDATLRRARAPRLDRSAVFLRDVGHGLLEVSHNTLALVGLAVVAVRCLPPAAPTCATRPRRGPGLAAGRHEARAVEPAICWCRGRARGRARATAADPRS
jgi:hypothetical protein